LPEKWVALGMSFNKSYDEWISLANKYNWDILVTKNPQPGKYKGHDTFIDRVKFSYISEGVTYEIELNFNSEGAATTDRNTLYGIWVRSK
jgi:hypothetical protein